MFSINLTTRLEVETPLGGGSITITGPTDKDHDGNPEVTLKVDLPGDSLDFEFSAEIPLTTLLGPPAGAGVALLRQSKMPGADFVADLLDKLVA